MRLQRAVLMCPLAAFLAVLLALISTLFVSLTTTRSPSALQGSTNAESATVSMFTNSLPQNRTELQLRQKISGNESSAVIERQNWRQRHLAEVCSSLAAADRNRAPSDLRHLYVNDQMCFIYCKVEKAACTTWKRTLVSLIGGAAVNKPSTMRFFRIHSIIYKFMRPLSYSKPDDIQHRLRNYYKFMFVRDPLERLVSAYRDKIVTQDEQRFVKLQSKIRRLYAEQGDKSLFQAFVRFVIHEGHKRGAHDNMNIHWRPQHSICRPCYVNYTFVGHHETLNDDADYVIQRLKPNTTFRFPRSDPDNKHVRSSGVADSMFSEVSDADIKALLHLYARDYQLLGYSVPQFAVQ